MNELAIFWTAGSVGDPLRRMTLYPLVNACRLVPPFVLYVCIAEEIAEFIASVLENPTVSTWAVG